LISTIGPICQLLERKSTQAEEPSSYLTPTKPIWSLAARQMSVKGVFQKE